MRLIALFCICLWAGRPAPAQERLTPEEFIDRAEGRTLTFRHHPDGALVGVEQFLSRVQSVWARADGRCTYGEITLDGMYVCFRYDDDPEMSHCWVPFSYRDTLIVRSVQGQVQQVTTITTTPLDCTDAPLS